MTEKTPVSQKKLSADWFFHGALTRIGDTLDRFTGRRWTPSSSLATSELVERLKRLLDAEVRDIPGKGAVVPHNLRLLVQWDKFSTDGEEGLKKLEYELLTAAADHINDQLYYTMSPLTLEVKQDYFVDGVKLSASFDNFTEIQHEAQMSVTLPSINVQGLIPQDAVAEHKSHSVYVARFILRGEPRDRRFELAAGQRISVGRTSANQLVIDDPSVSKIHASLAADGDGNLSVADTGSTNGTFLNGERIAYGKAVPLGPGDRAGFGDVEVVFDHIETVADGPAPLTEEFAADSVEIDGIRFVGRPSAAEAAAAGADASQTVPGEPDGGGLEEK